MSGFIVCNFTKYCYGSQITEGEMSAPCSLQWGW